MRSDDVGVALAELLTLPQEVRALREEIAALRVLIQGGVSTDSRGIKIGKTKTAGGRHRVVQALYEAGLTPATAAALCGTTRDALKQAWSSAPQFREIRPEWEAKLERSGVPRSVWPRKPERMTDAHRAKLSASRALVHSEPMAAARRAGLHSLADIAAKLGVSKSYVSQALSGKKQISPARAAAFERLTGYPASAWGTP